MYVGADFAFFSHCLKDPDLPAAGECPPGKPFPEEVYRVVPVRPLFVKAKTSFHTGKFILIFVCQLVPGIRML